MTLSSHFQSNNSVRFLSFRAQAVQSSPCFNFMLIDSNDVEHAPRLQSVMLFFRHSLDSIEKGVLYWSEAEAIMFQYWPPSCYRTTISIRRDPPCFSFQRSEATGFCTLQTRKSQSQCPFTGGGRLLHFHAQTSSFGN